MRTHVGFAAMVLAIGSLLTACADVPESDVEEDEAPAYQVKGGNPGTGSTNGLGYVEYEAADGALIFSMGLKLTGSTQEDVNPEIINALLQTQAGIDTLHYATKCTLGRGEALYWGLEKFEGLGVIVDAKQWTDNRLSEDMQNDVLACMIAHVNPLGNVNILLQGSHVVDDGLDHSDFDVEEALWVTLRNIDGSPIYYAIPLAPLSKRCSGNPFDALQHRVCGQNPVSCELKEGNLQQDCEQDTATGNWTCFHQPAIKTSLRLADFDDTYAFCQR